MANEVPKKTPRTGSEILNDALGHILELQNELLDGRELLAAYHDRNPDAQHPGQNDWIMARLAEAQRVLVSKPGERR